MRFVTGALTFLIANVCCASMTVAVCKVLDSNNQTVVQTKPIYPVRGSSLYRVDGANFVELKYIAMESIVRVYMIQMPHAPWTFGEKSLGAIELKLENDHPTQVALDPILEGSSLACIKTRR